MRKLGMHPGILTVFNLIEESLNNPIGYDLKVRNLTSERRH